MSLLTALEGQTAEASLRLVLDHFGCEVGTIHVIEEGQLRLRAHTPLPPRLLEPSRLIPIGKGLAGRVAESKKGLRMSDLLADTDPRIPLEPKSPELAAGLCVPLLVESRVVGTIGIAVSSKRTFSAQDEETLIQAGQVIARNLAV